MILYIKYIFYNNVGSSLKLSNTPRSFLGTLPFLIFAQLSRFVYFKAKYGQILKDFMLSYNHCVHQ